MSSGPPTGRVGPGGAPGLFAGGKKKGGTEGNQDWASVHQGCQGSSSALIEIWEDSGAERGRPSVLGVLLGQWGRQDVIYHI